MTETKCPKCRRMPADQMVECNACGETLCPDCNYEESCYHCPDVWNCVGCQSPEGHCCNCHKQMDKQEYELREEEDEEDDYD